MRRPPTIAPTICALVMLAVVVAPVLAQGETTAGDAQHGSTASCFYKYETLSPAMQRRYWGGILRRIEVGPPTMYSAGSSVQKVGWRFVVQRIRHELYPNATWKTTYKSPIQTAAAGPSTAASFSPMGVRVTLPQIDDPYNYDWNDVDYRVKVKMIWYHRNGSVAQATKFKLRAYQNFIDGEFGWTATGELACPGGHSTYVH